MLLRLQQLVHSDYSDSEGSFYVKVLTGRERHPLRLITYASDDVKIVVVDGCG